ncbi:S-adenosyl-L-methionine-dependent methyltransferase [Aspergillus cavernicola]|uniref:S-adenosyl-L-methionine-dependent methyltransferase n=1 Tax=Aspergillus cavernicola TaxID=176166 RepID=A0ABR4I8B7_9EURO
MGETAAPQPNNSMPESIEIGSAKSAGKRRWTGERDPEADSSETDSDEISIKSTKSFEAQNIEYVLENDRRYCNDTYFMPNDEAEQTRLNITHQIGLILLDGNLINVPLVKKTPRILDIGTGPGDWAIEMSAAYPGATIIATDIGVFDNGLGSTIELPNVSFQLDDARDEWTYHEPFDLIHIRSLAGAFSDWSSLYKQAFCHLTPGGYIEITDSDPAADSIAFPNSGDSYLGIFASAMRSAAEATGYPRDLRHLTPNVLTDAGFVDVRVLERTIPVGLWPDDPREKTLGKMALISFLEGLEAYSLRQLTAAGNWTSEGVRDLCEKVKRELLTAGRMTCCVKTVTARKPFSRAMMRKNHVLQRLMQMDDVNGSDFT